ncbi:MAG: endolytic transglycosylase MltG [Candidatus Peribacteraceae bacterium]|nr:endolytic transglycosylase MltG [Candidatus Peribacteraceae bacterium]
MKKFLFFIVLIVLGSWWVSHSLSPVDSTAKTPVFVKIESGESLSRIAQSLNEKGLIRSPFLFKAYAKLAGSSSKLQAGTFGLKKSQSMREIMEAIRSGKSEEMLVTIPEGYTVADIDRLMVEKGFGNPGDIIDCAFRCDFSTFDFLPSKAAGSAQLGYGSRLEGYLFPETYAVNATEYVPKFFLERMLGTFRKKIVTGYEDQIRESGRTLPEIVTMASLIEEESRRGEERPIVAGILWKRIDNGVVLGVDATTRYQLQKQTDALTKADFETVSAYNTRRNQGLPPSPIANAGESAFLAALKPEESRFWYYLHGPDGVIHYAVTNDEHNANRGRYLR